MISNLLSWGTWGAPCRRLIHLPPWRRQKPWLTKDGWLVEQLFHRKSKSSSGTKPCLCAYHSLAGCKGVNWKRYDSVWLCMTPPLNPTCKITASQEHVHRLMLGWPICAWIANSNSSISKVGGNFFIPNQESSADPFVDFIHDKAPVLSSRKTIKTNESLHHQKETDWIHPWYWWHCWGAFWSPAHSLRFHWSMSECTPSGVNATVRNPFHLGMP